MKVSSAVFNENYGRSSKKAILPLVPIETDEVPSNRMITHTLRSNPADANGPKYKLQIGILQGNESCRTIIDWRKGVQQILTGLAVDTHGPAIPIVETLMAATPRAGGSLASYNVTPHGCLWKSAGTRSGAVHGTHCAGCNFCSGIYASREQ